MFIFLKDNIDFIIKLLPLIFGILRFVRFPIEYYYAKRMESYFNIPYKYFILDWKKSLLETIAYAIMLIIFVLLNYLMILYRNEYTNVPALFFLFIFMSSIYFLCMLYCNLEITNVKNKKKKVIISILVSSCFSLFLVIKVYKPFLFYFLFFILYYAWLFM